MKKLLTMLVLFAGLVIFAVPAQAGTIDLVVTKTADTNDGACTQRDCSLREAIVHANTLGADNIDVPAGTYKLTIAGTREDLAATGDLDIRKGVAIRGAGARSTIIDGNGIDRVFETPVQPAITPYTVSISGVKITGGAPPPNFGGGGIEHKARGANLNLTESTVSGNSATNGGGINNGYSQLDGGTTTVKRSTISRNEAESQGGGIQNTTTMILENTTVSGNKGNIGGGILSYTPFRVTDSTIALNTARSNSGGIQPNDSATLKNTIVSNNRSDIDENTRNCGRPVISEGNNLENGTSCSFTQPTDVKADPNLGELKNNGGPTNTHALPKGSKAINMGGDPFPDTDQRGVTRFQGVSNDIGAYEKEQKIGVVRCPTGGSSFECTGTGAGEVLVGRDGEYDKIRGAEGDDAYNGKGGCDDLYDASPKSSDRYLVSVEDFCNNGQSFLSIRDSGGKKDVLDLSRSYKSTDFGPNQQSTTLYLDGPGVNDIYIDDFFTMSPGTADSIDSFVFSDKTLTAKQVRGMIE